MAQQMREEKEEEEVDEEVVNVEEDDPLCPSFRVPKEIHKEACKKWRNALIMKLLVKRLNVKFLLGRLLKMWGILGAYEFIDLENDYFLFRFMDEKDYMHVLQDGPWIIVDHYVTVQRWRPMFDPYDEVLKKLAIWIRIPGLPIELYTSHILWSIRNMFGRSLIIDKNSISKTESNVEEVTERAKFARICVEVDLTKKFLSKFKIGNRTFHVAYEGLHLICFGCGRYGHRKDVYPEVQVKDSMEGNKEVKTKVPGVNSMKVFLNTATEPFGEWMIVHRPARGRKTREAQQI
ncbi:uncharacterized protein LOC133303116 [Gastrolobium bilobum]|uniref:uncharacterized protein LOC133303116 n=1 Tax=Gastrolobium bilobum TaxID=150636 RepID=UPI002AB10576|nr:uncharacterized protein LOC133303116 [Gastrolobium bilobum]